MCFLKKFKKNNRVSLGNPSTQPTLRVRLICPIEGNVRCTIPPYHTIPYHTIRTLTSSRILSIQSSENLSGRKELLLFTVLQKDRFDDDGSGKHKIFLPYYFVSEKGKNVIYYTLDRKAKRKQRNRKNVSSW
jgi:hypothetical protein